MENISEFAKILIPLFIAFLGGGWTAYKYFFKASTYNFATKDEVRAVEVKFDTHISDLKGAINKMDGDLRTHIKITEQSANYVQEQLKDMKSDFKEMKLEINKHFEHLTNNIKVWNQSIHTHNLMQKVSNKLGIDEE